jgi:TPR repeat protein
MDLYRLYLDGASGVRRNSVEAIRWLTAASDLQYSPATFLLAEHYERGQGVSRDYDRAAELYERLVVEDHVKAILALADLYERGRGVARDRQRALSLFVKARELGDESVEKRIERLEKSL